MSQMNHKPFYDLEQIKQIPIQEVCQRLGINLEKKGGSFWCKLRSERTASTKLYTDSNTFYDFGSHERGDNIGLVSTYNNVDRGEAITLIANAFGISPVNPRSGLGVNELTLWDYEKIGLDGQLATKNFDFDLIRQGIDRVSELSARYAMPMNDLKRSYSFIYARLLKQRALPYVRDLRNIYYMDLFGAYNLAKAVGSLDVFHRAVQNGEFAGQIKELQNAERILKRACQGTQIDAWPVGEYNPEQDIEKIIAGTVKIPLGNASYQELKHLSEQEKSPVKYRTVSLDGFLSKTDGLGAFAHSAFLKDGNVVVGYLEKDNAQIKPLLDQIRIPFKESLNQKIAQAKQAQESQRSSDLSQKEMMSKVMQKGEER